MGVDSVKVLVVDGSVVNRSFFSEALSGMDGVEVAAVAANGKIALARLKQSPADLVLYDVEMEKREALEGLRQIRAAFPDIGLIPLCAPDSANAGVAIQALEMGALDLLTKPFTGDRATAQLEFRRNLEPMIRAFSGKRHVIRARRLTENRAGLVRPPTARGGPQPAEKESPKTSPTREVRPVPALNQGRIPDHFDLVAVAVSTGGPNALAEVIPRLPADLGAPVLLVQHMPPLFTEALANSLNKRSPLNVQEARSGDIVRPNNVYIAPGGRHMVLKTENSSAGSDPVYRAALNDDPPVNSCRPAADVLFESMAQNARGPVLAVIMTGMGADGVGGVRRLKTGQCYCLTQTEDSCVVYGMPRAVDEAGLSDERIPLADLAGRIAELVKGKGRKTKK